MIDDMCMRQFSPKTQATYLRIVREFARFPGRSPDTATVEDLRSYQLHLVDRSTSPGLAERRDHGAEVILRSHAQEPERMARMQPMREPSRCEGQRRR
jgi:hypothetical protein